MTAQIPEILILDGMTHPMTFCPPLPSDERLLNFNVRREHSTIRAADGSVRPQCVAHWLDAHGIEHTALDEPVIMSAACTRGYRGTWRIADGRLYLAGLTGGVRLAGAGELFADWVTDVLRVPLGDEVRFIDEGFSTFYERELQIWVERGIVRDRLVHDPSSWVMCLLPPDRIDDGEGLVGRPAAGRKWRSWMLAEPPVRESDQAAVAKLGK